MNILKEIIAAHKRIKPFIYKTPLHYSNYLSRLAEGNVYLKLENEQYTGSFKARGAINKLVTLKSEGYNSKIITASTGNHGLGVARAMQITEIKGRIVIPENADSSKVEALKLYNADIEVFGSDCYESEMYAKDKALKKEWEYISPYNDPIVIGGQGTIGMEISEEINNSIDNIFVTVGGGGLVSGIATYLKLCDPVKVWGCQPENSPEMALSIKNKKYTTVGPKETLSDGSAGAFEKGAITYHLCKKLVDKFVMVSEEEIAESIKLILDKEMKLIEGSAAVAVAAFIQNVKKLRNQTSVIIICGGNISVEKLRKIL